MLLFDTLKVTSDGKHLVMKVSVQNLSYYDNVYIDKISFDVLDNYNDGTPSSKAVTVYSDTGVTTQVYSISSGGALKLVGTTAGDTEYSYTYTLTAKLDVKIKDITSNLEAEATGVTVTKDSSGYLAIEIARPLSAILSELTGLFNEELEEYFTATLATEADPGAATLKAAPEVDSSITKVDDTIYSNIKSYEVSWDIDTLTDKMFFVYALAKGTPSSSTPCGMTNTLTLGIAYNKYPIYTASMKMLNNMCGCNPPLEFINYFLRLEAFLLSLSTGNYTKAIKFWNKFFTGNKQAVTTNCGCNG